MGRLLLGKARSCFGLGIQGALLARRLSNPLICASFLALGAAAQDPSPPRQAAPYALSVSVNEVGISFHAADFHDLPVLDLKPEEIDVFDNGNGPGQIISLQQLRNRPIHAGFLVDTSGSVAAQIGRNRLAAQEALQILLVQSADAGTAVAFGRSRRVVQSWTDQKNALGESLAHIGTGPHDPIDGTALYDTLFSTCLYEFARGASTSAANVILLFSDGEDTASSVTAQAAIDRCRQSHTAIYAFSLRSDPGTASLGPSTLRLLTGQTGGRLFPIDSPGTDVHADIETLAAELRNEYFLLYRPKNLKHDGAFHSIVLVGPGRVSTLTGTSGFYAPAH